MMFERDDILPALLNQQAFRDQFTDQFADEWP